MVDSYGDGWNGNTWHWVDASEGDTTGTLSSGSSGTAQLCVYNSSCYTFYVDASGNSTEEVSWTVTSGNYTIVSGGADGNKTSTCDQDSQGFIVYLDTISNLLSLSPPPFPFTANACNTFFTYCKRLPFLPSFPRSLPPSLIALAFCLSIDAADFSE